MVFGRYIDIEVSRNESCLGGIEVKSCNPPSNKAQQAKDARLLRENNYGVKLVSMHINNYLKIFSILSKSMDIPERLTYFIKNIKITGAL